MRIRSLLVALCCTSVAIALVGQGISEPTTGEARFQVAPGFVVERVAAPPLVEHPMMACFDDRGRLFIAESAGQNLKADDLRKTLPNFIRVLEPADESGRFTQSRIFAEKMTFPMGVLWYDDSLYAASSGGLWRFWDTTGKGVADKRQEIVTKFGYTGNAADIHGPFLGPDGRLYWCDGRHGHEIARPDGSMMKGKAARIFRSRPDGSDVEVVCGGGMDNPVEIAFTAEGEPLVTVNILHNKPRNDAIIYAIEGGNYPWHEVFKEFPRTGDLLPAVGDLGWVAPSGIMRYRSETFGKEFQGNLFSAQFNRARIQRHIVERDGAAFRVRSEDFLTSEDKNFHPTDVLEDADGSLLVIDTGGWFRIGCPTSKIAQPEFKGAIYRIRKEGAAKLPDAQGQEISWSKLSSDDLTLLLDDPRFVVRDRAIDRVTKPDFVPTLTRTLETSPSPRARRNAVWALSRIDTPQSQAVVRQALSDKDFSVRLSAVHVAGLARDNQALPKLLSLLVKEEHPAVRREAALALARLSKTEAVSALVDSLRSAGDRFLEHSLLFALIQIGDREATAKYLNDPSPVIRCGALIALDQMKNGYLTREQVTPLLNTDDPALQKTALAVISTRPGWGKELTVLLGEWLKEPRLDVSRQDSLRGVLVGLGKDPAIQSLTAEAIENTQTAAETRLLVLETMARASFGGKPPAAWVKSFGTALHDKDLKIVQQAVSGIRALGIAEYDQQLVSISRDPRHPAELRLTALAAAVPRLPSINEATFDFLLDHLKSNESPLLRLSAAGTLGGSELSVPMLTRLLVVVETAGSLELPHLLPAYAKWPNATLGRQLVAALDKSPGLPAVVPATLEQLFKDYPPEVRKEADRLHRRLEGDLVKQKERLAELEPLLQGGSAERGQTVFFGAKASCSACHVSHGQGGRIGPELSKIGALRSGRDLLEALVFPSASFARGYESYVVETRDGKVHSGILGRETADAVYVVTAERAEIRLPRSAIETLAPGRVSIMPQGLEAQLTAEELRDLLAYLQSLR